MNKIIFVINNFRIGGIQKSLVELLKVIESDYDITVYCPNYDGPLEKELPRKVKIIKGNKWARMSETGVRKSINLGVTRCIMTILCSFFSRCFTKKIPAKLYVKLINLPKEHYDVAISYSQPLPPKDFSNLSNEVVLYGINAGRKYTFIHCDYGEYGGRSPYSETLYRQFDGIIGVSNSVAKKFSSILPGMSGKVHVVHNACDINGIISAAGEIDVRYEKPSMVSVSRLSEEKGLPRSLEVVKNLHERGIRFEWHLVGNGPLMSAIETFIKNNGLDGTVFLEGAKENPYPYMKAADYLFLPSFHEAAPMVFNEAACLGTPILTTKTLSAVELVERRSLGVVCENNTKSIEEMLVRAFSELGKVTYQKLPTDYNLKIKKQFAEIING